MISNLMMIEAYLQAVVKTPYPDDYLDILRDAAEHVAHLDDAQTVSPLVGHPPHQHPCVYHRRFRSTEGPQA